MTYFLDSQGIMGKPYDVWSLDDLIMYWLDNKDTDPVLKNYRNYREWERDTLPLLDEL